MGNMFKIIILLFVMIQLKSTQAHEIAKITTYPDSITNMQDKIKSNQENILKIETQFKHITDEIYEIKKLLKENIISDSNKIRTMNETINKKIKIISTDLSTIKKEIDNISKHQYDLEKSFKEQIILLNSEVDSNRNAFNEIASNVNLLSKNTNEQVKIIKKDVLSKFVIAALSIIIIILSIIAIIIVFWKKIKKINLPEESIKLDAKLSNILENQLILMKKEAVEKKTSIEEDIDHSLPIRVGSEIFRMRKRIKNMDEDVKGLNALKNALTRLEDEFNQQGYVVKDITGKPYVNELTVKVLNYIRRDDLKLGEEIISRMITPLIYYKGIVVSHGEVEVAVSNKDA